MNQTLSQAIKDWEAQNRFNTYESAISIGIPRGTLNRYRAGSGGFPEGKNLILLAKALNVSVEDILMLAKNELDNKKDPQVTEEGE